MLNIEFPYLVHSGYDRKIDFPGTYISMKPNRIAESVREIQDNGCLHNQVINSIRDNWYGNPNLTHYKLTSRTPILRWEQLLRSSTMQGDLPVNLFDRVNIRINASAKFGLVLTDHFRWWVLSNKCNLDDGMFELELLCVQ